MILTQPLIQYLCEIASPSLCFQSAFLQIELVLIFKHIFNTKYYLTECLVYATLVVFILISLLYLHFILRQKRRNES